MTRLLEKITAWRPVEREWEKGGQAANVVLVEGIIRQLDRRLFYDRAADEYLGVAIAPSAHRAIMPYLKS